MDSVPEQSFYWEQGMRPGMILQSINNKALKFKTFDEVNQQLEGLNTFEGNHGRLSLVLKKNTFHLDSEVHEEADEENESEFMYPSFSKMLCHSQ